MKRWQDDQGQQAVQLALVMPLLLAFLGLVVDVGNVYVHHQMVSNAADAAAIAGATVLYEQGAAVAVETAEYYAAQHNYDNNGVTNVVHATVPPVSGSYAGNSHYIQVRIEEYVRPLFASLVWDGTFRVSANAVAGWREQKLKASTIVLNETACGALSTDGNHARMMVRKGNIHVNSSCSSAVQLNNGDIWTETPMTICGGYTQGPNGHFLDLQAQEVPPLTGQRPLPDPLADLEPPDRAGMPYRSVPQNPTTLQPGIYPHGITLSGSADVTLEPGIYILEGDLDISGTARVIGHDVFIYMAKGSVKLAGGREIQLDAPDSGPYQDVLIFQARDNTAEGHITGTPDARLEGIIYLPKACLWLSGNAEMATNLLVDKLWLSGNPNLAVTGLDSQQWVTIDTALVE